MHKSTNISYISLSWQSIEMAEYDIVVYYDRLAVDHSINITL